MKPKSTANLAMLIALMALPGCGQGGGPVRLPVHGTVSLRNGEKLTGSITLVPANGPGVAATTAISSGSYVFDRQNGPTAGRKQVTIRKIASKETRLQALSDPKHTLPDQGALRESPKTEWTLSANVKDDGSYACDLTLDP